MLTIGQLAERSGETRFAVTAVQGLGAASLMRSELDDADTFGLRLIGYADDLPGNQTVAAGQNLRGYMRWVAGDLAGARACYHAADSAFDQAALHDSSLVLPVNFLCTVRCGRAGIARQAGEETTAAALEQEALDEAERLGRHPNTAWVRYHLCLGAMVGGDTARAGALVEALLALIHRHNVVYWRWHAETLAGWAEAKAGNVDSGLRRLRAGLELRHGVRAALWVPVYLAGQAEVLLDVGNAADSLAVLDECARAISQLKQGYADPEASRLRALALQATGASDAAIEQAFDRAHSSAARGGMRLYGLRTAADRARRWAAIGRADDARHLLQTTLSAWPDETATLDLRAARAVLASLTRRSAGAFVPREPAEGWG